MRNGIRRPHAPVQLRESQRRVALPETGDTGLAKKMELAACLQMAPDLGPQDRPLPLMTATIRLAVKDQGRDIRIPCRAGPVAIRQAELHPHINAAVAGRAAGKSAVRIAQPTKTQTKTVKP